VKSGVYAIMLACGHTFIRHVCRAMRRRLLRAMSIRYYDDNRRRSAIYVAMFAASAAANPAAITRTPALHVMRLRAYASRYASAFAMLQP